MIKNFRFLFDELSITPRDLYELLGFEGKEIPEPFPDLILKAIKTAPDFCEIAGGYKVYNPVIINSDEQKIIIKEFEFSPGKIITTQLKKADAAAIFVCTAGEGISKQSKKLLEGEDPLMGYVFDVLGSVIVEKAMNLIQKQLEKECLKNKLFISDRYSPGYCDWSVSEQQVLFKLLPQNFCGVELSESSLMHPIKSISGIIGIGADLKQKGYQCSWCNDKNCIYGRIRRKSSKIVQ